jgi:hypothetical protein
MGGYRGVVRKRVAVLPDVVRFPVGLVGAVRTPTPVNGENQPPTPEDRFTQQLRRTGLRDDLSEAAPATPEED